MADLEKELMRIELTNGVHLLHESKGEDSL